MLFMLFYFFCSRYLIFCLEFSVMSKTDLIRKTKLISKFMMSQPGYQYLKISRSKFNAFTSYKAFLTSLPVSFSAWFLKKNISIVIFYYLNKFHCLVVFYLLREICIGQHVHYNYLLTRLWRHKFWNYP